MLDSETQSRDTRQWLRKMMQLTDVKDLIKDLMIH